jgi:hypothetical protein
MSHEIPGPQGAKDHECLVEAISSHSVVDDLAEPRKLAVRVHAEADADGESPIGEQVERHGFACHLLWPAARERHDHRA